jgi:transcriptional regulator with XRE-family HTH domain
LNAISETARTYRTEWERLRPFEEIARVVILRRGKLGLSQEEVAKRMGTTASVISRVESGQHATSMSTLKRLAEALELRFVVGFEDPSAKRAKRDLVAV